MNKDYYLFPEYNDIKDITSEELKRYGVGFRDKYIIDFLNNYDNVKDIDNLSTEEAFNKLINIKGIGTKVASCILLFGYYRFDVFPIDTWVRKFISSKYNISDDVKNIYNFTKDKFNEYSGLAIQYMYHSERNVK